MYVHDVSGGVLYLEGGEYFPDAFVEFLLKATNEHRCLSFHYTISIDSVWLLFVSIYPGGDVFDARYALTIVAESILHSFFRHAHFILYFS